MPTLSKTQYFPIVDWIPNVPSTEQKDYRLKWTGQIRPPKKGEWYISGAIAEGYRAPIDLTINHYIGKLVHIKIVTKIVEIK